MQGTTREVMKALSLMQPWAWLLFHGKDIENRKWPTKYRGFFLVHASTTYDQEALMFLADSFPNIIVPKTLPMGAIVGRVELIDCVTQSSSPWFFGPYGFVLAHPEEFNKPIPYKGKLGFFTIDDVEIRKEKFYGQSGEKGLRP